jgi:hypothetical protein
MSVTRFCGALILALLYPALAWAQAGVPAAGATSAAGSAEPPTCLFAGRSFGLNALFCVAPNVALQCAAPGRWSVIQGYTFGENVRPCANAPVLDAK